MSSLGSAFEKKIKKIFWSLASSRIKSARFTPMDFRRPVSVLALRPDRLGDFILSVPALKALESRLSGGSRLTLVAGERNERLARLFFPDARVLVFQKSFFRRLPLLMKLWFGSFDAVIDFHSYPFSTTSALLALLAGGPRRIGFWDMGDGSETSRKIFNDGMVPPAETLSEKEKSRLLIRRLDSKLGMADSFLRLPALPVEIRERVEDFFKGLGLGPRDRLIALHPTLLKEDNRWPMDHYVRLAGELSKLSKFKMAVVYGQGEEEELKRFLVKLGKSQRVFPLPGNELLFILECLKRVDLFVGGDSGLTHLAALTTPVVAIFGPSDPRRWGPMENGFGKPKIIRGKDGTCGSVSAEEVLKEIKKAFAKKARRSRRKI